MHSPDGSTFLREMTKWPPYVERATSCQNSEIEFCQPMRWPV